MPIKFLCETLKWQPKIMKYYHSKQNPFGLSAHAYFWEYLQKEPSKKHLDYGCNNGRVINELARSNLIEEGYGLDANQTVINEHAHQCEPSVELSIIEVGKSIPFEDSYFSSCSLFGVLEHIHDQSSILDQLNRVLEKDGTFIIAVPGKHFFSFLDLGNWKFVFPRLHRFLYEALRSKEQYEKKYLNNPFGLIGDIEAKKAWHQHFTKEELSQILIEHKFEVIEIDGCGFFWRLIHNFQLLLPKPLKKILEPLAILDKKIFSQAEIWALCKK